MAELDPNVYTVAWIAPLEIEAQAALQMLDNRHVGKFPMAPGDDYVFQAGDAGGHNIVIATLPPGQLYGTGSAAALSAQVKRFFPHLWFGLLVGVAAGLPNLSRNPPLDIRLGDVLVGLPTGESAGLIAYDLGKETGRDGFQLLRFGHALASTATVVRSAIGSIKLMVPDDANEIIKYYKRIENKGHSQGTFIDPGQDNDTLYQVDDDGIERPVEREQRPAAKRTRVWYGSIASGEKLMKDARKRNELRDKYGVIGLEMEAAGTMNQIPVGVIRGVCDYGDKYKNAEWQPYAAAMAAAYARAILAEVLPKNSTPEVPLGIRRKRKLNGRPPVATENGRKKRRSKIKASGTGNSGSLLSDNNNSRIPPPHRGQYVGEASASDDSMEMDNESEDRDTDADGTEKPITSVNSIMADATKKSLIQQLYFDEIDERLMNLTAAQGTTCRWFLTKSEYVSWHDVAQQPEHGGFLWIQGHPGTGKSTLMKFLFETEKLNTMGDPSQIILSFFFLAQGTIEEKSTTGLYRSLLHQLFKKASEAQSSLEWMTTDGAKVIQRNGWNERALKQTLIHAVQKLGNRSLTIFIDALDECDKSQVADMICFFEELCESARESRVRLQVCFSSRHYPTIAIEKGIEVILENEIGHTEDIEHYIKSKLRLGKSKQAISLRSEILEKSSKIFLWVVLVLRMLNREYPNTSVSIKKIRNRLKEIPPELNELFEMILIRDCENLERLQACLQWILFAARPLKPQELYFAVQFSCDKESSGYWDQEDVEMDEMKTFVRSCSKGLAEVTRTKSSEVQFIHESVRDFLLKKYDAQWAEASGSFTGHSHMLLRDCCLAQLKSSISKDVGLVDPLPHVSETEQLRNTIRSKYPFLEYSVYNVLHHANAAQHSCMDQRDLLANFPLPKWVLFNNALERYEIRRYKKSVSLLYILAERDLADLIRIHPQKLSFFHVEVEDERYGTPMFAALATNSSQAVWAFLQAMMDILPLSSPIHDLCELYHEDRDESAKFERHFSFSRLRGVLYYLLMQAADEVFIAAFLTLNEEDVDLQDIGGRSLLTWATKKGYDDVVTLLLAKDAVDPNYEDNSGRTPLSWAAETGDDDIVKLLLAKRGIDPDYNRDTNGRAPLSLAADRGHKGIVELLLATGDVYVDSQDNYGQTPLSYAAETGRDAVVEVLLATGSVDPDSKSIRNRTPLSYAAERGHLDVVKLLVATGRVDPDCMDDYGETPLSYAVQRKHHTIVELLQQHAAIKEMVQQCIDDPCPLMTAG